MSIAIVIMTHKQAAQALLESAEMICGVQENVAAIGFQENEDIEMLTQKGILRMNNLDISSGVLFLVDLFGGSPFHAAYTLSKKYAHSYVLTGVNTPMLMEALLTRTTCSIDKLYENSKQAGIQGIQTEFHMMESEDDE